MVKESRNLTVARTVGGPNREFGPVKKNASQSLSWPSDHWITVGLLCKPVL